MAELAQLAAEVEQITHPEKLPWDETPEGDQDDTIEFDADLAFELRGDR